MSCEKLQEKVAKAAEFIPKSFRTHAEFPLVKIDWIFEQLSALGIENSETGHELLMSEHCKFGYAREQFVDKGKLPIVIFSKIWGILREGAKEEPTEVQIPGVTSPQMVQIHTVGQMSTKELIEQYGPDCSSEIESEILKRSKGRNVIVFDVSSKKMNIKHSLKFMKEAKHHVTPSEWVDDTGEIWSVFPVGYWPNVEYDICPVTEEVLTDGYCASLGVSWSAVDDDCRKFIAVMKLKGIRLDIMSVNQVIDLAKEKGLDGLKKRFPTVTIEYLRLLDEGRLPPIDVNSKKIEERRHKKNAFEPRVHRH